MSLRQLNVYLLNDQDHGDSFNNLIDKESRNILKFVFSGFFSDCQSLSTSSFLVPSWCHAVKLLASKLQITFSCYSSHWWNISVPPNFTHMVTFVKKKMSETPVLIHDSVLYWTVLEFSLPLENILNFVSWIPV